MTAHLHLVTDDTTLGRAWRQLADTVRDTDSMVTVSHWIHPDGTPHYRVSARDFSTAQGFDTSISTTSNDLATACDQVRQRILRQDYDQ